MQGYLIHDIRDRSPIFIARLRRRAELITGFQIVVRIIMTMGLAAWVARRFERMVVRWGR